MPRVLVIDDDERMRILLCRMLERAGYEVLEAAEGKQGMKVCANVHPADTRGLTFG